MSKTQPDDPVRHARPCVRSELKKPRTRGLHKRGSGPVAGAPASRPVPLATRARAGAGTRTLAKEDPSDGGKRRASRYGAEAHDAASLSADWRSWSELPYRPGAPGLQMLPPKKRKEDEGETERGGEREAGRGRQLRQC